MSALITLPIGLPLAAAAVSIVLGRWRVVQRVISVATLSTITVMSIVLLVQVDRNGAEATQAGGWPAPFGITLVADRFAASMLVISLATLLAVMLYAIGQGGVEQRHVGFHPVYLAMAAGVGMSFLTGDLFNLFVAFEVMLTASYVLLTLGGRPDQVRTGMTYVVISLVASALLLSAVGFIYASTGTVNFAELTGSFSELPTGTRQALATLLLVVFGVKAAIFPLFFWLPDSYPTAPTAITAVFAGLLTKIGVYAIIRTQTVLLDPADRSQVLVLAIAGATMVVGVLGAIVQNDIKRILSFHIVSQIGYMIMGLGLFTVAGLAGGVLFILHQILVKATLFLTGGLVEHREGTGQLDRVGGLVRTAPIVAVLFLLAALSLAGIPPSSGFAAKLALVDAGLSDGQWLIVGVSLFVSLLTLFSMTKIWAGAFWGEVQPPTPANSRLPSLMVGATAAMVIMTLAFAALAGPLYSLSSRAAADLLDPSVYVQAVFG
jgi:multicomponent Na+:H+ antiporter subunit D